MVPPDRFELSPLGLRVRYATNNTSEGWIVKNVESIANCIDCGQCEEKCPYHLAIREKMWANVEAYTRWRDEVTAG